MCHHFAGPVIFGLKTKEIRGLSNYSLFLGMGPSNIYFSHPIQQIAIFFFLFIKWTRIFFYVKYTS